MSTKKRGFALLQKEEVSEIGKRGAKSLHEQGKAYKFTPETARLAGQRSVARRLQKKKELEEQSHE